MIITTKTYIKERSPSLGKLGNKVTRKGVIDLVFKQHKYKYKYIILAGADPGFQVRGGAHLKKLRRAEGGAKIFGVSRVRNHDLTQKNHIFFQF